MDQYATVDGSVEQVFAGAADPARLVDWLPDVVRVDLDANALVEAGSVFTLTLRDSRPAGGEVVAYEPPRLVAYRVFLPQPRVLRVVCTAHSVGRVRVHLYQTDSPTPIAADLPRLALLRSPPVRGPEIKTSPSGGAWGSSSRTGTPPGCADANAAISDRRFGPRSVDPTAG